MGDRTYVTLTVEAVHASFVGKLYHDDGTIEFKDDKFFCMGFEEVNYGNLHDLEKLLERGIAYETFWNSGDQYGEGHEYCRFTEEGKAVVKEIYESNTGIPVPDLTLIIDAGLSSEETLLKLTEEINKKRDFLTIRPWDNQEEYGKRYRARQLLEG